MNPPRHIFRFAILWLALLAASISVAQPAGHARAARAQAQHQVRPETRRERIGDIVLADSGVSLDQAVAMVERRFKARVVRTEVRGEGERKVYVLRLLNDAGRVWTVRVDASSGAIK